MRFLPGLLLLLLMPAAWADKISPIAHVPDWSALNDYQRTITHDEFAHLVNTVYSPDGGFWSYATLTPDKVTIYGDPSKRSPEFTLNFAPDAATGKALPYTYKIHSVSHDPQRPLEGIKIALDPGHIGGDWAKLEARYFKLGDDPPVEEAKLNLITCQILAERLEADGAQIVWAKHGYEPTTDERPDSLHREAIAALSPSNVSAPASEEVFGLPVEGRRSNGERCVILRTASITRQRCFFTEAPRFARAPTWSTTPIRTSPSASTTMPMTGAIPTIPR